MPAYANRRRYMRERITRGEAWWDIVYGFGRLHQAEDIFTTALPEVVKRRMLVDADISTTWKDVSVDERMAYRKATERPIVKLVLQNASDWDKASTNVEDYIDTELPFDVAQEIVERIEAALVKFQVPEEKKSV